MRFFSGTLYETPPNFLKNIRGIKNNRIYVKFFAPHLSPLHAVRSTGNLSPAKEADFRPEFRLRTDDIFSRLLTSAFYDIVNKIHHKETHMKNDKHTTAIPEAAIGETGGK
jgi:hypothetical protein